MELGIRELSENGGVFWLLLGGGHRLGPELSWSVSTFETGVNRVVSGEVSPLLRGGREVDNALDRCLRSKAMGTVKAAVVISNCVSLMPVVLAFVR